MAMFTNYCVFPCIRQSAYKSIPWLWGWKTSKIWDLHISRAPITSHDRYTLYTPSMHAMRCRVAHWCKSGICALYSLGCDRQVTEQCLRGRITPTPPPNLVAINTLYRLSSLPATPLTYQVSQTTHSTADDLHLLMQPRPTAIHSSFSETYAWMQQILMPCVVNAQSFLQCCVDFLINWHRLWWQHLRANLSWPPDFWGHKCANFLTCTWEYTILEMKSVMFSCTLHLPSWSEEDKKLQCYVAICYFPTYHLWLESSFWVPPSLHSSLSVFIHWCSL